MLVWLNYSSLNKYLQQFPQSHDKHMTQTVSNMVSTISFVMSRLIYIFCLGLLKRWIAISYHQNVAFDHKYGGTMLKLKYIDDILEHQSSDWIPTCAPTVTLRTCFLLASSVCWIYNCWNDGSMYTSLEWFITVMILGFRTDMPGQTVQTQIRLLLIRVYTVCHSVCIVWTHYSLVEAYSSHFRVITTNFLGVRIFRKFTVTYNIPMQSCFSRLFDNFFLL